MKSYYFKVVVFLNVVSKINTTRPSNLLNITNYPINLKNKKKLKTKTEIGFNLVPIIFLFFNLIMKLI